MNVFVDSSALVAILTREADADKLSNKLDLFGKAITSPVVIFESVLAIARKKESALPEAQRDIADFFAAASIEVVDITEQTSDLALSAFDQFGKGRHKAALNMGDCFSYACAKMHRVPLLFKGDDFIHTDIRIA
jgi:ribonuclease VapC